MATPDLPTFVIPDEKTPRLYGILNIVFASLLLPKHQLGAFTPSRR